MAGEDYGDTGETVPGQDLAHTRVGQDSLVSPLCRLQSMKTLADPSRHAELRFHSNYHHGTRGLDPTSGFAEALSSCLPPPASFRPQCRKATRLGVCTGDAQGGLWPGAGLRTRD